MTNKPSAQPERPTVLSIDDFLLQRGHSPHQVVNGESLHDLLWAFYVSEVNERTALQEYYAEIDDD